MPIHTRLTVAAAAAFLSTLVAFAAPASALTVGDAAPPLKVAKWVKGEPVEKLETGKVYVVEFWATWCGPCRATIPHVSELQGKHKDVVFIGQNVWEQDESKVEPFVKDMGEKMSYRVATDDKSGNEKGAMATTWMEAANQNGIPTAFIINKEGKVAWIGHPMGMEKPLDEILAGTFDIEKAKKEAAEEQAKAAEMEAVQKDFAAKVGPPAQSGDFDGAAKAVDEIIAAHPKLKKELLGVKFGLFAQAKNYDKAYGVVDEMYEAAKDSANDLNEVAWMIATNPQIEKRDLDRAIKLSSRAVELTNEKDANMLDTLAHIYADKGDTAKAVEVQTKAVAAAGEDSPQTTALKQTLESYKAKQAK